VSHTSLSELLDFGRPSDYERLEFPLPSRTREGILELPAGHLEELAARAFGDIAFFHPSEHLELLAALLRDAESSEAERYVAAALVRNAAVAAEGILPLCQDTGTAVAYGWKGNSVFTTRGSDETAIAAGAARAYRERGLRASQAAPLGFLAETITGDNLPALVDIRAAEGAAYRLCFAAKGGGSANRTSLCMESPALLDERALEAWLGSRIGGLGAAGCPPYRISFVLGGTGPDQCLYVLALAGLGLLDGLPAAAGLGPVGGPLRDRAWEARMRELAARKGVGAQFGGTRLALDVRAIRLSRHAASLPAALGVSCASHRKARAVIDEEGFRLERLEKDPGRFLPKELPLLPEAARIDLDRPLPELAAALGALRPGSFVLLSGTVILARDAAHARFRALAAGGLPLPEYLSRHPVLYAGPTEARPGLISGSFGPTTAGRMDAYLELLMSRGASLVTIAKGGRSPAAAAAIARHRGAYLACVGGAAALTARENVVSSEVIDFPELGMEAVRRVVLRELPAMLVIDAAGRDFYASLNEGAGR
jgi:fumarate hydratase class I